MDNEELVEVVEQVDTQQEIHEEQEPSKQEKTFTRSDIAKMLNAERSKWEKEQREKEDQAKKLAKMNAEQKLEFEKSQLEKRIAELEAENTKREMTATARMMLQDKGVVIDDELLALLVNEDAEQTKQTVESFSELFKKSVEKAVQERLKGRTPSKSAQSNTLTAEQILSVPDREERQRLIAENISLFQ